MFINDINVKGDKASFTLQTKTFVTGKMRKKNDQVFILDDSFCVDNIPVIDDHNPSYTKIEFAKRNYLEHRKDGQTAYAMKITEQESLISEVSNMLWPVYDRLYKKHAWNTQEHQPERVFARDKIYFNDKELPTQEQFSKMNVSVSYDSKEDMLKGIELIKKDLFFVKNVVTKKGTTQTFIDLYCNIPVSEKNQNNDKNNFLNLFDPNKVDRNCYIPEYSKHEFKKHMISKILNNVFYAEYRYLSSVDLALNDYKIKTEIISIIKKYFKNESFMNCLGVKICDIDNVFSILDEEFMNEIFEINKKYNIADVSIIDYLSKNTEETEFKI